MKTLFVCNTPIYLILNFFLHAKSCPGTFLAITTSICIFQPHSKSNTNKLVKAGAFLVPVLHPLSTGSRHEQTFTCSKYKNRNSRKNPEICSELIIKTPERRL